MDTIGDAYVVAGLLPPIKDGDDGCTKEVPQYSISSCFPPSFVWFIIHTYGTDCHFVDLLGWHRVSGHATGQFAIQCAQLRLKSS
jgi:hypothetical protein